MEDLKSLLPYCTPKQKEKIVALMEHGTHRAAAESLGITKSNISEALMLVRKKAAKKGDSPDHSLNHPVPDGFKLRKFSNLYGPDGKLKLAWVSGEPEQEKILEQLEFITKELCELAVGKFKKLKAAPKQVLAHLMTIYPQPEPHYGMFSWGKETGDDYDCSIAGQHLVAGMAQLVASSPKSKYAMISSIGDWFHTDTPENRTARAGNQLDVDTRWPRVVGLGVKVFITLVELALQRHEIVIIKGVGGNHDPQTNFMLAMVLEATFKDNPRVIVDMSPSPFKYHRFGKNLIGINHGDMVKPAELPLIMAADVPKDFGDTIFRLWLTGHIHHLTRKEYTGGIVVETVRSIAAKDSWHSASGYRSLREAKAIVLHKDKGEIQRITVAIGLD